MTETCCPMDSINHSGSSKYTSSKPSLTSGSRGSGGYPIVLTGDRTLFADYRILLEGMMSASQTSVVPSPLMKWVLARPVRRQGVHALQAPLGLRRIEAALCAAGIPESDIAVTPPECLDKAIGPETRIIGISSGDPLGIGMSSTTMAGITGGEIYVSRWFRILARRVHHLRQSAPRARVVMGGAGAWQLAQDEQARTTLGVDHVVTGYCEGNVGDVFAQMIKEDSLPPVIEGQNQGTESILPVRGATVMGGVEISRGCGFGCQFCTLAREPMHHIPLDAILSDATTNLAAGVKNITLITEDAFRYGTRGQQAEPEKLIALLEELRSLDGLSMIQTDHANIATLAQIGNDDLWEIRRLMTGHKHPDGWVWLNLGIETASGGLLLANGGKGKMGGASPDEWGNVCLKEVRRLTRLGFFPLVSLIIGLPDETSSDLQRTLRWVNELRDLRAAVFPVFHAPLDVNQQRFGIRDMSDLHWQLFRACYRLNFRHMPGLFWDNQTRGGVSLLRRLFMQMLGHAQVWWWRSLFVFRSGKLFG